MFLLEFCCCLVTTWFWEMSYRVVALRNLLPLDIELTHYKTVVCFEHYGYRKQGGFSSSNLLSEITVQRMVFGNSIFKICIYPKHVGGYLLYARTKITANTAAKKYPNKLHIFHAKKPRHSQGFIIIFIILLIRIPQVVDLLGFRKILLVCFLL